VLGLIVVALLLQIVVLLAAGIETKQRSLEELATGNDTAGGPVVAGVEAHTRA
jgi:hypothetical protein